MGYNVYVFAFVCVCWSVTGILTHIAYALNIFPVFVKVHICGKLKPRSSNLTAKSAYFLSGKYIWSSGWYRVLDILGESDKGKALLWPYERRKRSFWIWEAGTVRDPPADSQGVVPRSLNSVPGTVGPGHYAMCWGRGVNKVRSRHLFHKKRTYCSDRWRIEDFHGWEGTGLAALWGPRQASGCLYVVLYFFIDYSWLTKLCSLSGVQRNNSDTFMCICMNYIGFLSFFSIMVYYRLLNIVPYVK